MPPQGQKTFTEGNKAFCTMFPSVLKATKKDNTLSLEGSYRCTVISRSTLLGKWTHLPAINSQPGYKLTKKSEIVLTGPSESTQEGKKSDGKYKLKITQTSSVKKVIVRFPKMNHYTPNSWQLPSKFHQSPLNNACDVCDVPVIPPIVSHCGSPAAVDSKKDRPSGYWGETLHLPPYTPLAREAGQKARRNTSPYSFYDEGTCCSSEQRESRATCIYSPPLLQAPPNTPYEGRK